MIKRVVIAEPYKPLHIVYSRTLRRYLSNPRLAFFFDVEPLMGYLEEKGTDLLIFDDALPSKLVRSSIVDRAQYLPFLEWYRPRKKGSKLILTSTNPNLLCFELEKSGLLHLSDAILDKPSDFASIEECLVSLLGTD